MIKLISVIFFCAILGYSKADYCQDNFTLGELPNGILQEALALILTGTLGTFQGCPGNIVVPDEDVKFWYFSRNNPEVPVKLDPQNPHQVNPTKSTKVLIPGWLCNVTNDRMPELRRAYLQQEDCNIIGIDWTARSIDLYSNSFCSVPGVAKIIARLLCSLPINLLTQLHLLGHSMGGQISGITGYQVQQQCGKNVGRITALDPAGPLYQTTLDKKDRLDASDAVSVGVIHTNQGFLGFFGNCGDVDFYPNCGIFQPGCLIIDGSTTIAQIINLPLGVVACNHLRSLDYMIESINPGTKTFVSTSCLTCPAVCIKDFIGAKYTVMGEDCPANPPALRFTLRTNDKPPFAQG